MLNRFPTTIWYYQQNEHHKYESSRNLFSKITSVFERTLYACTVMLVYVDDRQQNCVTSFVLEEQAESASLQSYTNDTISSLNLKSKKWNCFQSRLTIHLQASHACQRIQGLYSWKRKLRHLSLYLMRQTSFKFQAIVIWSLLTYLCGARFINFKWSHFPLCVSRHAGNSRKTPD